MLTKLKVNHIVLRFDNVMPGICSESFDRVEVPGYGTILSMDFSWRRSVAVENLATFVDQILRGRIGEEVHRLVGLGLRPVLHIDFASHASWNFFFSLDVRAVKRLSRLHSSFSMIVRTTSIRHKVEVVADVFRSMANVSGSIELS